MPAFYLHGEHVMSPVPRMIVASKAACWSVSYIITIMRFSMGCGSDSFIYRSSNAPQSRKTSLHRQRIFQCKLKQEDMASIYIKWISCSRSHGNCEASRIKAKTDAIPWNSWSSSVALPFPTLHIPHHLQSSNTIQAFVINCFKRKQRLRFKQCITKSYMPES